MDLHRTDEERVESLKKWWTDHGRSVAAGVVAGVAGISGWTFWQSYEQGQAEAASTLFGAVSEAAAGGDHAALEEAGAALLADHSGSGYAPAASLLLAKSAFDRGRTEEAKARFEWVLEHAAQPGLRAVARLRLAEVAYAGGAFDETLRLLDELDSEPFAAAGDELRGDVHHARRETEAAREAWQRAAAGYGAFPAGRQRVALKLDDLGRFNTPVEP